MLLKHSGESATPPSKAHKKRPAVHPGLSGERSSFVAYAAVRLPLVFICFSSSLRRRFSSRRLRFTAARRGCTQCEIRSVDRPAKPAMNASGLIKNLLRIPGHFCECDTMAFEVVTVFDNATAVP
jgi:hypothetical protein